MLNPGTLLRGSHGQAEIWSLKYIKISQDYIRCFYFLPIERSAEVGLFVNHFVMFTEAGFSSKTACGVAQLYREGDNHGFALHVWCRFILREIYLNKFGIMQAYAA